MSKAAIAPGSVRTHLGWIKKQQLCAHKALWDMALAQILGWSLLFTSLLMVKTLSALM